MGAAQKCVGRATDPHALGFGGVDQLARLGDVDAERFFGMNMFAGGDRSQPDFDMRFGNGEVDDDLDSRIGEQRLDRACGQSEFAGPRFGGRGNGVRQRDDIEDRKLLRRLQIGWTNIAAADDANADALQSRSPISFSAAEPGAARLGAGPVVPQGAP